MFSGDAVWNRHRSMRDEANRLLHAAGDCVPLSQSEGLKHRSRVFATAQETSSSPRPSVDRLRFQARILVWDSAARQSPVPGAPHTKRGGLAPASSVN